MGAAAVCAIALAFLLDASTSVSPEAWKNQTHLTADALEHPEVASVIEHMPDDVMVSAIVFASNARVTIPWTSVKTEEQRAVFTARLRGIPRDNGVGSGTNIGKALSVTLAHTEDVPCVATQVVIDISTDGIVPKSAIATVEAQRDIAEARGITINTIGFSLAPYFESFLNDSLRTSNGFATVAEDWQGYTIAIRRKIIKEIALR